MAAYIHQINNRPPGVVERFRRHRAGEIGALDTMIAAHALALDAVLVANNLREFAKVPGLRTDKWV